MNMVVTEFTFADWVMFVSVCSLLVAFSGLIVFFIRECTENDKFSLVAIALYFLGFSYFSAVVAFVLYFIEEFKIL